MSVFAGSTLSVAEGRRTGRAVRPRVLDLDTDAAIGELLDYAKAQVSRTPDVPVGTEQRGARSIGVRTGGAWTTRAGRYQRRPRVVLSVPRLSHRSCPGRIDR